nr:basic proline-rich protein-like [Ipomoea batatas]
MNFEYQLHLFVFSLLFVLISSSPTNQKDIDMKYGVVKRLTLGGPNLGHNPGAPPPPSTKDIDMKYGEVKRLTPTGPNPRHNHNHGAPPCSTNQKDIDMKYGVVKRLTPTGPNPKHNLGAPRTTTIVKGY